MTGVAAVAADALALTGFAAGIAHKELPEISILRWKPSLSVFIGAVISPGR